MTKILNATVTAALLSTGITAAAWAQSPKMKTDIPEAITTPDRVETRIGTLEFFDGIPTKETSSRVYDYLDFSRAMETFLHGIPAASVEGLRSALLRSALSVRIRSCTLTS